MCPIETPEGPNIGLIGSLASMATVSEFGFIQTPYRIVKGGKVTDEIVYLDASEEAQFTIAQASEPIDDKTGQVPARAGALPLAAARP
jgi:DNA-directed RNA polymerase subunit beta